MKPPEDCESLPDVREAIDELDREVVALIGRRARYVAVAGCFKRSEEDVRASERQRRMLEERRRWATEEGLDPGTISALFQNLIDHFVEREMQGWMAKDRSS